MRAAVAALLVLLAPALASAQEGWPIGRATAPAGSRVVVALRAGELTVVTLTVPDDGPLVIPLPGPIEEADLRSVPLEVLTHLDDISAPELVGYVEMDPCSAGVGAAAETGHRGGGSGFGTEADPVVSPPVRVEGHAVTASLVLDRVAARDTAALETWIAAHHVGAPDDLRAQLRPHVEAAMAEGREAHLLVVTRAADASEPAAVQLVLRSERFEVPVGFLGGARDVVLVALTRFRRQRVVDGGDLLAETDVDVRADARRDLPALHATMLARRAEATPGVFLTETTRRAETCQNCSDAVDETMLATLGADRAFPRGFSRRWEMPDVDVASVEVEGATSEEIGRRVLRRMHPQIAFCFEQAVMHFPSLGGDAALRLSVSPDGAVSEASIEHDGWAEPVLTECMLRAGRRWTFPAAEAPSTVVARYAFTRGEEEGATRIGDWVLTRLRARLDGAAPETIVLEDAPPMRGGSEVRRADEGGPAVPDFHTRYVIRHPWSGPIACEAPERDRWIDPPSMEALTLPEAGALEAPLSVLIAPPPTPVAPPPTIAPPVAPAPAPAAPAGCACRGTGRSGGGPLLPALMATLAILALLNLRRRFG